MYKRHASYRPRGQQHTITHIIIIQSISSQTINTNSHRLPKQTFYFYHPILLFDRHHVHRDHLQVHLPPLSDLGHRMPIRAELREKRRADPPDLPLQQLQLAQGGWVVRARGVVFQAGGLVLQTRGLVVRAVCSRPPPLIRWGENPLPRRDGSTPTSPWDPPRGIGGGDSSRAVLVTAGPGRNVDEREMGEGTY